MRPFTFCLALVGYGILLSLATLPLWAWWLQTLH